MYSRPKKIAISALAAVFALALMIPAVSFADADGQAGPDAQAPQITAEATVDAAQDGTADAAPDDAAADDCIVTLEYYENVGYDDPDVVPDEEGRFLLGTRVLTGLHEGDLIDTWDYVADIPGFFFFDAWPAKLKVSADPAQNIIKLFYFKTWDSEYTVNYYLMTGADLSADNWSDALDADDVDFIKMGSQTFDHQRFDSLVEGDAYEYKLNGLYVIDTYPAEIRLSTDPDDNVINVLYTPESQYLPDDIPAPGEPAPNPDAPSTPDLPGDTTIGKDDLESTLPGSDEVVEDFIGNNSTDEVVVTDEMLQNTISKAEAKKIADAYRTGLHQGTTLTQTGDNAPIVAVAVIVVATIAIGAVALFMMRKRKNESGSE